MANPPRNFSEACQNVSRALAERDAEIDRLTAALGEARKAQSLYDECRLARDATGYIGTVPQCIAYFEAECTTQKARAESAERSLEEAREALAFYADRKNWDDGGFEMEAPNTIVAVPSTINKDVGRRARAIVGGTDG